RLISFGLSEKEAQLYFHLLKYGPKPPSLLAKSLKTYREDIYRTLNGLIDKGMVNPSLDSPTVYAAVDIDVALDAALKKHETQLREMERRKQELQEMSKEQRFRPSDEFSTFKILKNMRDVVTTTLSNVASTEKEWIAVVPTILTVFSSLYFLEDDKKFIDRGGKLRFITDITYPYVDLIQQHLDIEIEVQHLDKYTGILFCVFDRKISMSAINADIKHVSLNEPVSVLWTDDPTYAEYLLSTFELLWQEATPAAQRIEEIREQPPPHI
ncbi:MAG TPA: helix-turn-helix domain-containing protein, partial [Candidatus Acidoferrales bacterium]|nr:helix-turn-helix domain-containing protein [Candidatus Acidoferrales bacterium]